LVGLQSAILRSAIVNFQLRQSVGNHYQEKQFRLSSVWLL